MQYIASVIVMNEQTPKPIEMPEHIKPHTDAVEQAPVELIEMPESIRTALPESARRTLGSVAMDYERPAPIPVERPSAAALRRPGSGYTEVAAGKFVPDELVQQRKE
jgi:hypothetical protein